MPMWLQHALVLTAVAGCVVFIATQALRTLRGSKGKLGACCAKGCEAAKPQAADSRRVVFLPVEMLVSSKKRSMRS